MKKILENLIIKAFSFPINVRILKMLGIINATTVSTNELLNQDSIK